MEFSRIISIWLDSQRALCLPIAKNTIVDIKVKKNSSIDWLLAKGRGSLELNCDWALVTSIKSGVAVIQGVFHSNCYPISPSIAAVKELVARKCHIKPSIMDCSACCTGNSSLNPVVQDHRVVNILTELKYTHLCILEEILILCIGWRQREVKTICFIETLYGIIKDMLNVVISESHNLLEEFHLWITNDVVWIINSLVYHCSECCSKIWTDRRVTD